jgi:hypothetical protein
MNPNITNNRTVEEIQNSNSFVVPTPPPTASDMTATLAGELQKATQQGQLEQTQAQEKIKAGETDVNSIFQQILGEAPERAQLEQQQGLPQQTKEFRDLQALQMQQTAEYLRGLETIGNKAITQEARGTGERALTRQRGIDAMITSSLLQAKQGNIEFAQNLVNSAIDAKYTPLKQTLAFKQDLLAKNYENLTRAEKKVADAKKDEWNLQMTQIEKQEKEEKEIQSLALTAISKGNAPADIFAQVQGKSMEEAITTLAPYLKTPSTDVIKLDNGSTLLIDKNTGKIIKNFGGAKPKEVVGVSNPIVAQTFGTLINTTANLENTVAGKQAVREQLAGMLANGDYKGAYNQIANSVATGLMGETKNRFENARIDIEVMSGFRNALQEYINAGGDTGLLKGKAEEIERKLGRVSDPKLTALAVQLQREFQSYRQAMTGAAFTPKESSEYASVNPTAQKSLNLNLAVIDGALNQLKNRVDGTIRAKVPQASDIQKLIEVPLKTENAKVQVNNIYKTATPQVKTTIENLIKTGKYDDALIIEYLKTKGIIK